MEIEEPLFENLFKEFIEIYFSEINKERDKKILYRRYGIKYSRKFTLEEIGKLNNITRQRVEQIEKKHIKKLLLLLNGESVKRLNFEPNNKLKNLFSEIKITMNDNKIIGNKEFFQLLNKYFKNCSLKNGYIILLLDLLKLKYISYNDFISNIFYQEKYINKKTLKNNIERIYKALRKEVIPISYDDLIIKVIGRRKNYNVENIKLTINALDEIEKININDIEMLQLNTLNKFSAGDLGYRVLFHNESPMSNDQLLRKVNNLLNEQGYNRVNRRNLLNQLTDNDKIKNIGQGKWALNDWDYEKNIL
ncbi:sigma factor-like helix-turn-helix DNA-binding protein [Halanaerobium salsuginis]|uniref:Sigma-70, region 4 n=1 Tax=Halanaerobium salsuginis TaxID=29563 RepID=A0A1I4MV45_9FIRM|nr:sigma factor-like helix-turn-helix DNA-binding protein [Halanaerobium salsuginis]SFM07139.1 Sigma-70, region 4 [Halanaerobium salsuginis]